MLPEMVIIFPLALPPEGRSTTNSVGFRGEWLPQLPADLTLKRPVKRFSRGCGGGKQQASSD
jgi:hypothetical protein